MPWPNLFGHAFNLIKIIHAHSSVGMAPDLKYRICLYMIPENIFDGIPENLPEELCTTILQGAGFRVERIISRGHASPPGFWYDQEENEWLVVLTGSAAMEFEGAAEPVELRPGSCLDIHAHARHRVLWTNPDQQTVWLAIYYEPAKRVT
jgi:cupin 2 domain-containing protein